MEFHDWTNVVTRILQFGKVCLDKILEKLGNFKSMAVLLQGVERFYAKMKKLG